MFSELNSLDSIVTSNNKQYSFYRNMSNLCTRIVSSTYGCVYIVEVFHEHKFIASIGVSYDISNRSRSMSISIIYRCTMNGNYIVYGFSFSNSMKQNPLYIILLFGFGGFSWAHRKPIFIFHFLFLQCAVLNYTAAFRTQRYMIDSEKRARKRYLLGEQANVQFTVWWFIHGNVKDNDDRQCFICNKQLYECTLADMEFVGSECGREPEQRENPSNVCDYTAESTCLAT